MGNSGRRGGSSSRGKMVIMVKPRPNVKQFSASDSKPGKQGKPLKFRPHSDK